MLNRMQESVCKICPVEALKEVAENCSPVEICMKHQTFFLIVNVKILSSILDTLLFLLFINDLPLYTHTHTFIYDIQESQEITEQNLQSALNQLLYVWCKRNGILLNSAKVKIMLV